MAGAHIVEALEDKYGKEKAQEFFDNGMQIVHGCSDSNDKGLLTVIYDWNHGPEGLEDLVASLGADTVYDDDHSTCEECGQLVSTRPMYSGWTAKWLWLGSDIVCKHCAREYPEHIIEEYANQQEKVLPPNIVDVTALGFVAHKTELETGLHIGMNADLSELDSVPEGYDYILTLDESSQFYVTWSIYIRKQEDEE